MKDTIQKFWLQKLDMCKTSLEANNFEVFITEDITSAKEIILTKIIPETSSKTISYGGSVTIQESGVLDEIRSKAEYELIETLSFKGSDEEVWEKCRQALLVDLYISGSNAITETGELINLDMWGNRVGAITFGPKHVVVIVGRNKIVADTESGLTRIQHYAAPLNAIRHALDHGKRTPCVKTSVCMDCKSPDRICNYLGVTKKSYPAKRIKVIIINESLGL